MSLLGNWLCPPSTTAGSRRLARATRDGVARDETLWLAGVWLWSGQGMGVLGFL